MKILATIPLVAQRSGAARRRRPAAFLPPRPRPPEPTEPGLMQALVAVASVVYLLAMLAAM